MLDLIVPKKLRPGDKVAAISLSWGGPGEIAHRYEAGKKQLEEEFNLQVVESTHALRGADWLYKNPQARADDLIECFQDPSIKAIISTIGGDDSVRILPFLDPALFKKNPKIFMGYSDSSITHIACLNGGLRSYYGPSFMSGFAENTGMFPYMVNSIRKTLFNTNPIGVIEECQEGWTDEHLEWEHAENQRQKRKLNPSQPWTFLQGSSPATGHLVGGCADVLECLKGTAYWPHASIWQGAILFLETSENGISPSQLKYWLRNYGTMGILDKIAGILFARPGGGVPRDKFNEYDEVLLQVVRGEFDRSDMPIVTGMDFGHTDPMFVIPYGAQAQIDPMNRTLTIVESGVRDG